MHRNDVVLGPTEDGGYYLVAARDRVPPIFSGISWSTESVWPQTIARLQSSKTSFAVLPTWYDVDEQQDLERLLAEVSHTLKVKDEADEQFVAANRLLFELKTNGENDELLSGIGQ